MKEKDMEEQHNKTFDELKHINENGNEFWYARDLQHALAYSRWEKFFPLIEKAKTACENSGQAIDNHFHHLVKMVVLGSGSQRKSSDQENENHFVEMHEMLPIRSDLN